MSSCLRRCLAGFATLMCRPSSQRYRRPEEHRPNLRPLRPARLSLDYNWKRWHPGWFVRRGNRRNACLRTRKSVRRDIRQPRRRSLGCKLFDFRCRCIGRRGKQCMRDHWSLSVASRRRCRARNPTSSYTTADSACRRTFRWRRSNKTCPRSMYPPTEYARQVRSRCKEYMKGCCLCGNKYRSGT